MPKQSNQKLKIMYLYKILNENTDEQHRLTINEIIQKLGEYGISAERKSLYSDIELLQNFGVDIICEKKEKFGYYIASRDFELAELKMLVDSVQASRFITEKKTDKLIKKIEKLASKYEATQLQRQVYIAERAKADNEKIYYVVDTLHKAINENKKILFKYFEYDISKNKKIKNDGNDYCVSPYSLVVADDNYYMICNYPKYDKLTHFRVDRMDNVRITSENSIDIKSVTNENFNIADYSKKNFNMFKGEQKNVRLLCHNSIVNAIIDKFGESVTIIKNDDETFFVNTSLKVSPPFYAWVFMFGDKMKIVSPDDVKTQFEDMKRGK